MRQYINEETVPYLQLLNIRTVLSMSPIVREMNYRAMRNAMMNPGRLYKDFCIKVSASDVKYLGLAKLWRDLDNRWPRFTEKFASRVEIVDESFLRAVHESRKAFFEEPILAGEYLAHKTFSGTIVTLPKGTTLSYWLSFDGCDEPKEDCSILMLDDSGMIKTGISPALIYTCKEVKTEATKNLSYVMPPLDTMMGAAQMKNLVRNYLLYSHFASVKAELVPRYGSQGRGELTGDSDAMVNCFPFDLWRLNVDGPFVFPEAGDDENDADND